jgi:hypothetical protein
MPGLAGPAAAEPPMAAGSARGRVLYSVHLRPVACAGLPCAPLRIPAILSRRGLVTDLGETADD